MKTNECSTRLRKTVLQEALMHIVANTLIPCENYCVCVYSYIEGLVFERTKMVSIID